MPNPSTRKKVVITIPLSKDPVLNEDQKISLRHLQRHLGAYDTFFLLPESSTIEIPGIDIVHFGDQYFGSVDAYNGLMLSRGFYERFAEYEFMLHYHLDALVFSDQLLEWCDSGFDYLAPPWFKSEDAPWVKNPTVGNGGFSLRRIDAFLKVFDSHELAVNPEDQWKRYRTQAPLWKRMIVWPRRYLRRNWRFNGVHTEIQMYLDRGYNEDMFWGHEAKRFNPDFKLATYEAGRRFAFEIQPRHLYEENGNELPFGCHAFGRYDREFWEPYLLKE